MRFLLAFLVFYAASAFASGPLPTRRGIRAIDMLDKLLAAIPADDPIRPELMLGKAKLIRQFDYIHHPKALAQYIEILQAIRTHHPNYEQMGEVLGALVEARIASGDLKRARAALAELERRFPRSMAIPRAWYAMGNHHLEKQDWRGAIRCFRKLRLFPGFKHQQQALLKAAIAEAQLE